MEKKKILFISNGYGEDAIAVTVINKLLDMSGSFSVVGFPLVGEGRSYTRLNLPVVCPVMNLPSGGLIPAGWLKNLWTDFRSGLAALTLQQINQLRSISSLTAVVAVGDTYPVLMGGLFTRHKVIFVGTAKSDYFVEYSRVEREVFRRFTKIVFPRDEPTASSLRNHGIKAQWQGNAMMDGIEVTGERFGIHENTAIITLLPGSRDFAYTDLPIILEGAEKISAVLDPPPAYLSALAPSITLDRLGKSAETAGFDLQKTGSDDGVVGYLTKASLKVTLLRHRFGDSISLARLIIGQAGTGNEQAAGLGKPIVGFDSQGQKKPGWYRARQKGLLGDSLAVVDKDSEAVSSKALEILQDEQLYIHMSKTGRERMGPPGGAARMARYILKVATENGKE